MNDPKKILIICDLFPPAFGPRMGYLCKYLKRLGWTPVVLTETVSDETFAFLAGDCPVTRINFYTATGRLMKKLQWMGVMLLDYFFGYKDARFYREASQLYEKEKFSLVLCSAYRTFPLPAALKTAKKLHIPLVTDLRDIIEQYTGDEYISRSLHKIPLLGKGVAAAFREKALRQRNKALRQAACVTTVSPWHVDVLKQYNPNVKLIYNGFDPDIFYPEQVKTEQFNVTYTGRILSLAMRDPSLLFEAVTLLAKEGKIGPADFRVRWFVDETSEKILKEELKKYAIPEYMDFYGYVPAHEVPAVLNGSSVLLQLANRSSETGPKGLMTTKLFESFAVKKPMLCVRSDESHLEQAIREARAGVAARNVEETAAFLLEKYEEWKQKGYTEVDSDKKIIESYSREGQARQFANIFGQLIG